MPSPNEDQDVGWAIGLAILLVVLVVVMVVSSLRGVGEPPGTTTNRPAATTPERRTPSASHPRRYAHQTINVRSGPGTGNPVVRQVSRGASVYIGRTENGWAPVFRSRTSTDTAGFIYAQLLEMSPLPDLEIASWNWRRDPGFGGDGAVIWTAVIRNNTNEYKRSVRVEFTSLDAAGRVIDTDYSYASGLAPRGTASVKGYATYYGREDKGRLRVVGGY